MTESPTKGEATRTLLAESMLRLIHRKGYHGAGLNAVVEESGAPKGSVYFHFPGGKSELGQAALTLATDHFSGLILSAIRATSTPIELVDAVVEQLSTELTASDFATACPVAAVTLDAGSDDADLRAACGAAYASWAAALEQYLTAQSADPELARQLSSSALSMIEGALIICRAQRSVQPLRDAAFGLKLLLGSLAPQQAAR